MRQKAAWLCFDFRYKTLLFNLQKMFVSQNCEKQLLVSLYLSFCPSVRMEHLGFDWTEFDKICYTSIFSKMCQESGSVIKI
jgi:hypothetical protein